MFKRVGEIELESKLDEESELKLIDEGVKDIKDNLVQTEVNDCKK